ncbi:ABC1 kinase family protein [Acetohalobium arabaticum]|uniref:ABC-1 domain protein n=1 Tax=Acetohalobium arabaticum (strain ATCC 49924 / DSM 5501 / Z-7288) TaxID=574087 RepID=D9QVJ5_ACEAZ|nr:AarF/ABC1/UbiB kinase family protein [Acetohalobium arabaticum]ADL12254.1 ABC-1 domain protein [Acetohalobium arabaticum DSM 5501]
MIGFRGLNRRYRHIQRYRKIAEVLIKNGFGYLLDSLDLYQFLPLTRRLKLDNEESEELSRAERLRLVLEELGPTFIKLGQLLSTRQDLIPQEYIKELTKLQDDVPPFSFELVLQQVEEELNQPVDDLFANIEKEPLAAASIGQVHKAVLKNGQQVVIKVQRPEIRDIIETDLDIIFNLAEILDKRVIGDDFLDPVEIASEFNRIIKKELDYQIEGRNTEKFNRNFADEEEIKVPKIYWELSTKKLLVSEYIEGTKLSRIKSEDIDCDYKKIAQIGANSFMKQVLVDGFFHGDPHPGNVLITPEEKVAFIDFGIVGRIDKDTMEEIADLFLAVINRNIDKMVDKLLKLGMLTQKINRRALKRDMGELLDEYYGADLKEIDISRIINQMLNLAFKYRVQLPTDFILLGKALMTVEGIGRDLDPDFNVLAAAKPFAYQLLRKRFHPKRIFTEIFSDAKQLYHFLVHTPKQLERILKLLERQDFKIELRHIGLEELISKLDIITNRLSVSIIVSALIVGSSYIMQTDKGPTLFELPALGLGGYLLAGFFGLWLVISILRSGRF